MAILNGWETFYVIIGSAAGALIGLQFVVITLITEQSTLLLEEGSKAFASPTIAHFGVVLFVSSIASAPWTEIKTVAAIWGLIGLCGVIYIIYVARHLRAQSVYRPVFEDWFFHVLLPFVAYTLLAGSACMASFYTSQVLFAVGAALLLLLIIGIHNAWDAVTYHVFAPRRKNPHQAPKGD